MKQFFQMETWKKISVRRDGCEDPYKATNNIQKIWLHPDDLKGQKVISSFIHRLAILNILSSAEHNEYFKERW